MRLAILRPTDEYYVGWQTDADNYKRLFGDALELRIWSDPGDLSGFDLILPLLAWGYQREPARWYGLLDTWKGLPFANGLETLRWNTNKAYLRDMDARDVPIVPTRFAATLGPADIADARALFGSGPLIVKPAISGGAEGTYRLDQTDPIPADVVGREMLIQPLMRAIAEEGEYSLFHFGGRFSHAILKRPAKGDFRVQEQFGGQEIAIDPPAAALALSQAALAAAPGPLLYARVDMVRDDAGAFRLMELELIEPSLFLTHTTEGGAMFAHAVVAGAMVGAMVLGRTG